ncbi:CyP450 monooxygenase [Obba rivulosa]|uniref:CyP450 monooxygenase n=1 Tax=Obba rivulosa TaxID=1052685 RepID=A0A8E2AZ09_9APHY|nr:CyP450 monooxygenase [Obba rivulosa]
MAAYLDSSLALFLAGVALVVVLRFRRGASGLPYPPGPKGWPIIGNLLDVPTSYPWLAYKEWSKRYGPIVHVKVLGQSIIILNDAKAVSDLLEARSANYSSREMGVMISLLGLEWDPGFMPYGPKWRKHRRLIQQYFNPEPAKGYQSLQLKKAHHLLQHLRRDPANFLHAVDFIVGSSIIELVYGHVVKDASDPYLEIVQKGTDALNEGLVPGKFLVEFLPFLRHVPAWFPGAHFKRKAAQWQADSKAMVEVPFNATKGAFDRGLAISSVVTQMLEQLRHDSDIRDEELAVIRGSAGVMYGAGAETTYITIQVFFLTMVLYPEVQKKAQAELEAVVGPSRLPEFSDRDALPYVNAIVMECMRWMPVIPLGVPHASISNDVYDGYHIPKGSVVIGNSWAILHDSKDYPEPEVFKPERFLKDGRLDPDVKDPSTAAFGFGRRICPGRFFADATLYINMACILHVFDIKPSLDEWGHPVLPEMKTASGFFAPPLPFKCDIAARSSSAEQLIEELQ